MAREIQDFKELFINFLLENNCYSQFVTNLLEQKHLTIEEYVALNEKYHNIINLIFSAFNWSITPEKSTFWLIISSRWKESWKRLNSYL